MYLNKVTLIGNLTRDPELKALPTGQQVCTFSIATNETYKDKNGTKQEKVEFHNIVAWGTTAKNIATYMKKGSQILVEGKIQTRSWEKDGAKHYRTEIMANTIQFGSKPQGSSSAPTQKAQTQVEDDYDNLGGPDAGDELNPEDIPF